MYRIIDTHAHYDDPAFDDDRDKLISELLSDKVCCIVNQGTDLRTSVQSTEMSSKYKGFYAAVGLHPEQVSEEGLAELEDILALARNEKVVAIGEIGLDYYYETPRELQKKAFEMQLQAAKDLSLPVNIHDREAHGDMLEILKVYRPQGILHCFSGSVEMAGEVVRQGMYIGVGGVITFKNAKKAVSVIKEIPLDRIVLETDCPYLSPEPFRGKRNHSGNIEYTAKKIAEIKGISLEEVIRVTCENALKVYDRIDRSLINE